MHTVLDSPQVLSTTPLSSSVCTRDWVIDDEDLDVTAEHTIQIFDLTHSNLLRVTYSE